MQSQRNLHKERSAKPREVTQCKGRRSLRNEYSDFTSETTPRFIWNGHLKPLFKHINVFEWFVPIIHGYLNNHRKHAAAQCQVSSSRTSSTTC